MVRLEMVQVTCGRCDKNATVAIKVEGDPSCPSIEIYCRKHGQSRLNTLKTHYTAKDIKFVDTTFCVRSLWA